MMGVFWQPVCALEAHEAYSNQGLDHVHLSHRYDAMSWIVAMDTFHSFFSQVIHCLFTYPFLIAWITFTQLFSFINGNMSAVKGYYNNTPPPPE
jgi:hypothetical protein